jgi:hypothetical protein
MYPHIWGLNFVFWDVVLPVGVAILRNLKTTHRDFSWNQIRDSESAFYVLILVVRFWKNSRYLCHKRTDHRFPRVNFSKVFGMFMMAILVLLDESCKSKVIVPWTEVLLQESEKFHWIVISGTDFPCQSSLAARAGF